MADGSSPPPSSGSSPPPREGYDSSILHEPANIDANGPVGKVKALLLKRLRLHLQDGRILIGVFSAYDKFGNFVLTDAEEHYGEQRRQMSMVIVPLSYLTAAAAEVS
jgi:small nuclear ribonucleoprotein (snRNP)-like protein